MNGQQLSELVGLSSGAVRKISVRVLPKLRRHCVYVFYRAHSNSRSARGSNWLISSSVDVVVLLAGMTAAVISHLEETILSKVKQE